MLKRGVNVLLVTVVVAEVDRDFFSWSYYTGDLSPEDYVDLVKIWETYVNVRKGKSN